MFITNLVVTYYKVGYYLIVTHYKVLLRSLQS